MPVVERLIPFVPAACKVTKLLVMLVQIVLVVVACAKMPTDPAPPPVTIVLFVMLALTLKEPVRLMPKVDALAVVVVIELLLIRATAVLGEKLDRTEIPKEPLPPALLITVFPLTIAIESEVVVFLNWIPRRLKF